MMLRALFAGLSKTVGIACVVALIIQIAGLLPPPQNAEHSTRHSTSTNVGVVAHSLIQQKEWEKLDVVLRSIVAHNELLQSVEVSDGSRQLIVAGDDAPGVRTPNAKSSIAVPLRWRTANDADKEGVARLHFKQPQVDQSTPWKGYLGLLLVALSIAAFVRWKPANGQTNPVVPDRVRDALDTLSEGLLVLDEQERVVLANQSFLSMVGLEDNQLIGRRAQSLTWMCSRDTSEYPWTRAIQTAQPETEQLMRYQRKDGSYRFFSINCAPIQTPGSKPKGVLATFRDVTATEGRRAELEHMLVMLRSSRDEISSKNRELKVLAEQDALTGCLNRRALFQRFETLWMESKQSTESISCLLFDCDHFKAVNDTYGHQTGDEVLKSFSETLKIHFPSPALVCRYGGEEFCVVMPNTSLRLATESAEKARLAIEWIRLKDHNELRLTTSIGVSASELGAAEPQELINQSDQALYAAKGAGRNQLTVFSDHVRDGEPVSQEPICESTATDATGIPFQAVTALVSALAYRDAETAEHSRRVADLCVRAATGLLDQRSTYVLEIAALLHDIGKIGVPDHVLLKPGPLTEDEWKMMRRHDRIGIEIVSSTFNCDELSEIMRSHHSHFSSDIGPLSGIKTPLGARLLAIADSYDAMVSDRVFRPGRSHEEAISELRRCAGSQFDPSLVEHFATTITQGQALADQEVNAIPKQTAMQIGLQIERLADALDARDVDGLQTLASRLGAMARHHQIESIAVAAEKIESDVAEDNVEWIYLLQDTQLLMNLCRSAQNAFLAAGA